MTIRKRLFISNILMLVIPALLALLVLAAALLLFFSTALPSSGYHLLSSHELSEARGELTEAAADWLSADGTAGQADLADRLRQTCQQSQMTLVIEHDGAVVGQFGTDLDGQTELLRDALGALGNDGVVSDGNTDLFGAQITVSGAAYQIWISNPVISVDSHRIKVLAVIFAVSVAAVVLLIIFLTNRFLIHFVFQNIAGPLRTLTEGVRQIRDGNLSHRISYQNRDEFLPVCEAFNDMAVRLRASVEQSQKEEASRKELLASISHDIRSPLTAIRAYVEGLLDGVADTPERQRAYLSIVQRKTIELDRMVKKLFLFSKMDMGEYPYSPERIALSGEIGDFVLASEEEYRRQGLRIVVRAIPQDLFIQADPTYFHSILTNLLDNSAKYRQKEVGTAVIAAEAVGQQIVLTVEDDGPGVPEEALPKLFDVFYRSDPARKHPNQGSGLGLAIVSKSVERMGGHIRAENRPEGGLRMTLVLPRAQGE